MLLASSQVFEFGHVAQLHEAPLHGVVAHHPAPTAHPMHPRHTQCTHGTPNAPTAHPMHPRHTQRTRTALTTPEFNEVSLKGRAVFSLGRPVLLKVRRDGVEYSRKGREGACDPTQHCTGPFLTECKRKVGPRGGPGRESSVRAHRLVRLRRPLKEPGKEPLIVFMDRSLCAGKEGNEEHTSLAARKGEGR